MNPATVALIIKGLGIAETLVEAGISALPTIKTLWNIATKSQEGTISADDLAQAEAELDAQIDEFNAPI